MARTTSASNPQVARFRTHSDDDTAGKFQCAVFFSHLVFFNLPQPMFSSASWFHNFHRRTIFVVSLAHRNNVKLLQRYWVAALLIAMVIVHAAIIGYVRNQISRLSEVETTTVSIGSFRFQSAARPNRVYQFDLHAVLDPSRRHQAQERIAQQRFEILEAAEQFLRQSPAEMLQDPTQTVLRDRLMEVILEQIPEPVVQRVVITGWLELPVGEISVPSSSRPVATRLEQAESNKPAEDLSRRGIDGTTRRFLSSST